MATRTPKYRLHKPTGQAVVTLGGRDFYLGKYGTAASEAEYRRLLAEFLAAGCVRKSNLTVSELIVGYLRHCAEYYQRPDGSPSGETERIKVACRPLRSLYGATSAADFGPLALKAVRKLLVDGGKHCRKEINKRLGRIVRLFKWGVENELVPESVWNSLKAVPGLRRGRTKGLRETEPVKPVEESSIEATRPHLPPMIRAMVDLQLWTGARPGEVCVLRPCDLDRSESVWLYRPYSHKTSHHGHERRIYIGPHGQTILLPWLDGVVDAAFVFSPARALQLIRAARTAARKTPLSCGNRVGTNRRAEPKRAPKNRYTTGAYGRAITRGCEACWPHPTLAGKPRKEMTPEEKSVLQEWNRQHRWRPHQLRHTAATRLRREFGSLELVRIILGHRHAVTTDVYAEADWDKASEAMKKLG